MTRKTKECWKVVVVVVTVAVVAVAAVDVGNYNLNEPFSLSLSFVRKQK